MSNSVDDIVNCKGFNFCILWMFIAGKSRQLFLSFLLETWSISSWIEKPLWCLMKFNALRGKTHFFHANDVWLSMTQLWRHICYHIFLIYFLIYNVQWATNQFTNALVFVEQKSNSFVSVIPNQCIYSVTHWHLHQNK